jgi:GTPase SAR1 family protein
MEYIVVIRKLTDEGFIAQSGIGRKHCKVSAALHKKYQITFGTELKVNMALAIQGTYIYKSTSMEELIVTSIKLPNIPVLLVSGGGEMYGAVVKWAGGHAIHIWEEDLCKSVGEIVYCAPGEPPIIRSAPNEQLGEVVSELLSKKWEVSRSTQLVEESDNKALFSVIGIIRRFTSEGFLVETQDATLKYKISQEHRRSFYDECVKVYHCDIQLGMAIALISDSDASFDNEGMKQYEATSIAFPTMPVLLVSGTEYLCNLARSLAMGTCVYTIWEQRIGHDYAQLLYHAPGKLPISRRTTNKQLEVVLADLLGGVMEAEKEEKIEADVHRSAEDLFGGKKKEQLANKLEDVQSSDADEPVFRIPTVLLIGEISSGKSSLLNSLAGGYVAIASLQRETMRPSSYLLGVNEKADAVVQRISKALETIHRRNEAERARIADLAEEDLCKLEVVADQSNPIHFDLGAGSIEVIDFAGINDADDKEGRLFLPIQKHINGADLVIFVTAADRAFQNSSEVASFKRLQALVAAEVERGHYVDLVVVVNKFDDATDPDLMKIWERIPERIGLSKEKILRVSSHKMLLSNVKVNSRKLYIPNFARREIAEILKTANVQITSQLKAELAKSGTISHLNIEYQLELDDLLSDEPSDETEKWEEASSSSYSSKSSIQQHEKTKMLQGENNISACADGVQAHPVSCTRATNRLGDWDGLIRYLGLFGAHLPEMTSHTMKGMVKARFVKWADACIKVCDTYQNHGIYNIDINSVVGPRHSELADLMKIYSNKVSVKSEVLVITEVMEDLVDKLWPRVKYPIGCTLLLEMLLPCLLGAGEAYRGIVRKILELLGDAGKMIAGPHTDMLVLCECIAAGFECPDGLIKAVLSDPRLYGYSGAAHFAWYDSALKSTGSSYPRRQPQPLRAGEVCYQSWAVQTLLNYLPGKWARLLKLATMPATYVRNITDGCTFSEIPDVLGTSSDFSVMLMQRLSMLSDAERAGAALGASLFKLEEETTDYMKLRRLFLEGYPEQKQK